MHATQKYELLTTHYFMKEKSITMDNMLIYKPQLNIEFSSDFANFSYEYEINAIVRINI